MTTTYTFEQLKVDVKKEAEALRVHATAEELGRLSIEQFNPDHTDKCIYGQIAGSCISKRAHTLISTCCSVMVNNELYCPTFGGASSIIVRKPISESYMRKVRKEGFINAFKYLSAIEAYILLPEARNANLIAYLRGETDNLDL